MYVTYIRTTAEKLWQALIDPEFTERYWCGTRHEVSSRKGGAWRIMAPDGRVADSGEVLEIEPHRRLVLSWRTEFKPELREEGFSRLTYELENRRRIGEADRDSRDGQARLETHRYRLDRLAPHPGQFEEPAGNRGAAGRDDAVAEGRLKFKQETL